MVQHLCVIVMVMRMLLQLMMVCVFGDGSSGCSCGRIRQELRSGERVSCPIDARLIRQVFPVQRRGGRGG